MEYKTLKKLQSLNKDYYSISDLEKILGQERDVLYVTLHRMVKKGWLRRLRRGIYQIDFSGTGDQQKIASQLYLPNYLSFESALSKYGVIFKVPYNITFATTNKTKKLKMGDRLVEFRQLKKELFFGYSYRDGINIAEPEKALLDQLYLVSLGKGSLDLDELDLKKLSSKKFMGYAKSFPQRTRNLARRLSKEFGRSSVTII